MLVFWPEKLVFLAVPKTGTTALHEALAPRADMVIGYPPHLKHSPYYRYRRFLQPFFEKAGGQEMETMAVIRHPVDWLSSWYRYRNRDDLVGRPNSTREMTFDGFVDAYCKGKPPEFARVGSQSRFVLNGNGELAVDHLFRYEDQPRLIAFLEDRLKTRITLSRANVSPTFEVQLSSKVEDKLRRKRPEEFSVWEMAGSEG